MLILAAVTASAAAAARSRSFFSFSIPRLAPPHAPVSRGCLCYTGHRGPCGRPVFPDFVFLRAEARLGGTSKSRSASMEISRPVAIEMRRASSREGRRRPPRRSDSMPCEASTCLANSWSVIRRSQSHTRSG
jgi:hypothetical protein